MKRALALLLLVVTAGCSDRPPGSAPLVDVNAPPQGASGVDEPHVVFTSSSLVIDEPGVPVRPPVTTPSQPSRQTVASDDEAIVAVTADGGLVGLRPGKTTVRAFGSGSSIAITVVAPTALVAVPSAVALRPGGRARLQLQGNDGVEIPPDAVRWDIAPGVPVAVVGGEIVSMGGNGEFRLTAHVGVASAVVSVTVATPENFKVSVSPPRTRMTRGQVKAFQAFGPQGAVRASWASSAPRVVEVVADGLFEARRPGRARVCAYAFGDEACSEVEVTP